MPTQTSVNNEFKTTLRVIESTAGTTAAATIANTDNSNVASHAKLVLSNPSASVNRDAYIEFKYSYVLGLDNSDSDALVLSSGSVLGTANNARCTAVGEWTYPLQSGFFAYPSAQANNVTGNGATFSIVNNTELYDNNLDYSTATYKFTAPKSGVYLFTVCAFVGGCTIAYAIQSAIQTTGGEYAFSNQRPASNGEAMANGAVHVKMDAGDTAYATVVAYGEAGNTDEVYEGPNQTYFCGALLQ